MTSSKPSYFTVALPSNTITLGDRVSTYELLAYTNTQSTMTRKLVLVQNSLPGSLLWFKYQIQCLQSIKGYSGLLNLCVTQMTELHPLAPVALLRRRKIQSSYCRSGNQNHGQRLHPRVKLWSLPSHPSFSTFQSFLLNDLYIMSSFLFFYQLIKENGICFPHIQNHQSCFALKPMIFPLFQIVSEAVIFEPAVCVLPI